jgi:hypothetical protein
MSTPNPLNSSSEFSSESEGHAREDKVGGKVRGKGNRSIQWPRVISCLQSSDARELALGLYKSGGHTPDTFRSSRPAREAMANALTRAEDLLEQHRRGEQTTIKMVRRALELELWP